MIKNILKFFIILFIFKITKAQQDLTPQITASISEVFLGEPLDKSFKKLGNKAYHFGQSKVSWYKATIICRSLGGYLASIDTQQELKDLSNLLTSTYGTDRTWWLSGSDQDSEDDFYWYSTGRRLGYADWAPNQPDNKNGDENCIYLEYRRPSFQMYDGKCDRKMYYICENKSKTIVLNVY
ncbi:C-type lectin 37Db-like [Lucilia sericata]|uniref:C-type lectin 37Db-like n=1 Tax=Lucilia sericata TaxID=13632 RepID=UPI0018A803DE|nr:C-type lectin 37Db-like [Lucilia sericata]